MSNQIQFKVHSRRKQRILYTLVTRHASEFTDPADLEALRELENYLETITKRRYAKDKAAMDGHWKAAQ